MIFAWTLAGVIAALFTSRDVQTDADDAPSEIMLASPPGGVTVPADLGLAYGEGCGEGDVKSTDEGFATGSAESGIDVGTSKSKLLL